MKFSVLLSVYCKDDASFFKEALFSVSKDQTVKPAQIVVVEDGYVPEGIEHAIEDAVKASPECEFTVVRKPQNAGLAAALNTGLKACKYEWVARMDSDDISLPDRFDKQLAYIENYPNVDVIGGAIAEFRNTPGDMQSERHVGLDMKAIRKMAKTRTPMNHVSVMFKKSAVEKAGGYCENFGKLEDYKLWVDLLGHHAVLANIDDVVVYVRTGNGFISRRSNRREITDWDMLQSYLLGAGIINRFEALKNRLYIRTFIYMPGFLKIFLYKTVLRK
jgi:glycosyltransferase involved in cell wall biosynthesis